MSYRCIPTFQGFEIIDQKTSRPVLKIGPQGVICNKLWCRQILNGGTEPDPVNPTTNVISCDKVTTKELDMHESVWTPSSVMTTMPMLTAPAAPVSVNAHGSANLYSLQINIPSRQSQKP